MYVKKTLIYSIHRKIAKFLLVLFLCTSGALLSKDIIIYNNLQFSTEAILWEFQAIVLLIPCVIYFVEIFRSTNINLIKEPSFWIITGLSFFMLSTLPVSFLFYYIVDNHELTYVLSSIFNLFYILLFIMITRGHLCKKEIYTKPLKARYHKRMYFGDN